MPKSDAGNISGAQALDHLSLAVEAANSLKTNNIVLPVWIAKAIISHFNSPPPTRPPIADALIRRSIEIDLNPIIA
jgi:hypothetical protein